MPKRKSAKMRQPRRPRTKSSRKRFTPEQRAAILAAARAQKLTGKQVAKKYGIAAVTYYLWRKKSALTRRGPGRPKASEADTGAISHAVRAAVKDKVQAVLPDIVREEVDRAIDALFGSRRR
ncbi:MAG TPA: transposase [Candidatus Saccharimonadaceae bacterium]|jgi:transposase-like protein|nr:transposase [Candidatus Saccharimonadaceae bacterium]